MRWINQKENIGAFPNMREVLLAAKTKYCVYLGDDDYLLPDEVQRGIDFLESHPNVIAYFAPCDLYDQIDGKTMFKAFECRDTTYKSRGMMWDFIINSHVFPEHCIYRREGLEGILQPRVRAYWAFTDIAVMGWRGPIHFASTPFYRNIVHHPVGHRSKLGDRQCLTDFDEYRGGLENLAYDWFRDQLHRISLQKQISDMINKFILARIRVAHRLLERQGITDEAASYAKRLALYEYHGE